MLKTLAIYFCSIFLVANVLRTAIAQTDQAQRAFFESKIRPVLVKECYGCHSNKSGNAKGGLRLDTRELMHIGGESGPAIVPGDLDESLLYNAITHQDFVMPPRKQLNADVINDFRLWIEAGAFDPRTTAPKTFRSSITSADIAKAKRSEWSFQRPVLHKLPAVNDTKWARSDLDHFVLAKLEENQLRPSSDAQSHEILRRLCYDLIGLPPTPEQIEYFNRYWNADADKAIRFVVDQLLDAKQFGERWGRHWLDVARYAESTGREVNMTYPHAWRYRDYVIDSFNEDKPYDRFLREQLAGDLLSVDSDEEWAENLIATTFLVIGPKALSERNRVQSAADLADEQIDTTTRVILGMSVACARCHDHKFDPIPQTDYYAMAGIFRNMESFYGSPASKFGNVGGLQNRNSSNLIWLPVRDAMPIEKPIGKSGVDKLEEQLQETMTQLAELRRQRRNPQASQNRQGTVASQARLRTRAEYLSAKLGSYDDDGNPISLCMGVQEVKFPKDVRLLVRGEIDQPAQIVERNVPQVLRDKPIRIKNGSSGRLEMAEWISSKNNPLTARVMVNRIWQHMFGERIVRTTENFGSSGEAPTHPELLDSLAVEFMKSGWSVKHMIRTIATSRTYRMSSKFDAKSFEADPENHLLWRATPRRLDAEALRDSMLFVSGELEFSRPHASEVAKAGYMRVRNGNLINPGELTMMGGMAGGGMMTAPTSIRDRFRNSDRDARQRLFDIRRQVESGNKLLDMVNANFRSVYLPAVRDNLPRSLDVFDLPDSSIVTGRRESSNTANQALYLMNNDFVIQQSRAFAKRLLAEHDALDKCIKHAFVLAYGRDAKKDEVKAASDFISELQRTSGRRFKQENAIAAVCQSLFASAEFRYID
ncbi:MAG: PSD1 domain-containing protein [Planctomycetales bacterium]|nr:PSD1 domain-containing protein [Planctomycetales bacterium]